MTRSETKTEAPGTELIESLQRRLSLVQRCDGSVRVEEHGLREPTEHEAVVQTTLSCVSPGTELRVSAAAQSGPTEPWVPGYARVGRVTRSGRHSGLIDGERVVVLHDRGESPYRRQWGGHTSASIVTAHDVVPIPASVSDRDAVLARLAAIPMHGVRLARPGPDDSVVVLGLGFIGLAAAKFCALSGCSTLGLDRSPPRVEIARQWGLEAQVDQGSAEEAIRRAFPDGPNLIIDATGVPTVPADAVRGFAVPAWGRPIERPARYMVQGSYPGELVLPYQAFFEREVQVLFPRDWESADLQEIFSLLEAGRLKFDAVPASSVPPQAAAEVYASLRDPRGVDLTALFSWS